VEPFTPKFLEEYLLINAIVLKSLPINDFILSFYGPGKFLVGKSKNYEPSLTELPIIDDYEELFAVIEPSKFNIFEYSPGPGF
jgi:hypothetical protein